jgi:group II intron reverse transcriptase/maturase
VEDKVVQEMARCVLEAIYEPVFIDTSYGFRPGRSCHDALRQLNHEVMSEPVNWLLDMDLAQFFDTMPHTEILAVLSERIADQRFLRLIARMLKAGVYTPGGVVYDELGSPQGSIVSPVIANAFLDHVLDQWVVTVVRQHCRGYCALIRYADDAPAVFEREDDARRFGRVLPLRLGKFGLRLNREKTRLLACGKRQAWRAFRDGSRLPTFDYLGFTHYWGRSRTGKARLKRKTSKKRLRRALVAINVWLRQERNARKLPDLWQAVSRKRRGHFNYFGVTDNSRALHRFQWAVQKLLFKWLNRRSQRRSFTWESFCRYFQRHPLPKPGQLGATQSRLVNNRVKRLVRQFHRRASVRGRLPRCMVEYCDTLDTERREQQGTRSRPKHGGVLSTRLVSGAPSIVRVKTETAGESFPSTPVRLVPAFGATVNWSAARMKSKMGTRSPNVIGERQ